jgi:plastocyanin
MLSRVRAHRLAFPLAILLCLVLAAPAAAAFDWKTQVVDFEFQPAERKISVGDTVTWNFAVDGHTSASVGGQPDSWRSVGSGANPASTSTCACSIGTS